MDQLEELEEEDLDALFEEFGEVVRSDKDSNNVTSEVDEDSDSLACKYSGTFPLCSFHQVLSRVLCWKGDAFPLLGMSSGSKISNEPVNQAELKVAG